MASNVRIRVNDGDISPVAQAEILQRLESLAKRFARLKDLDLTLEVKNSTSPRASLSTTIGEREQASFTASGDNAVAAVDAAIRKVSTHLNEDREQRQKRHGKATESSDSKLPTIAAVAVLLAVVVFVGVWLLRGDRGIELIKVHGRVTFNGDNVPGPGQIFFTPASTANRKPSRAGSATFDSDGLYAAGSFDEGDGLMPGYYNVAVKCWEVSPNGEGAVPVSHIPKAYTKPTTSGLTVNVTTRSGPLTFDIPLIE